MNEANSTALLGTLLAEIERAWIDRKDRTAVYRLAHQYPQFEEEFYEFFDDLILGPEGQPSADTQEAEENVHRWILESGLRIAGTAGVNARTTPATPTELSSQLPTRGTEAETGDLNRASSSDDTWVAFLRRSTGMKLRDLTAALPHVTTEYLVLVSRHPTVVPEKVKRELAGYTEERFGIRTQDSLEYLSHEPRFLRAASRSQPFESGPVTFEDLLDRSALDPEQKAFWLRCGGRA